MKTVRCAIYTRKSSDEGLDQAFNSLDAQHESCAAYILSQASEGWTAVAERYDDGGLSGGTLQRPALQRLLADITAGKVDIVVVYKVDRLTRSLLDFAKLVETFDAAGASFVSITQSFNTTTSMGRLTLNMLLSFAQFEREVTAERIRDKIAASKAKGMWMGGNPPLGYRPDGRTLAIVEEHADLVRSIFRRYRELGSVRLVAEWLEQERIYTPLRQTMGGREYGGVGFSRGQLYAILRNPIYVGDVAHRGSVFRGQHPALLPREKWEATQAQLSANAQGSTQVTPSPRKALLADILFDADGQRLIPVHSTKGARRYHYYVSEERHHGNSRKGMRVPAQALERLVIDKLADLWSDPIDLAARISPTARPGSWTSLDERGEQIAARVRAGDIGTIKRCLSRVTVGDQIVEFTLIAAAIAEDLAIPHAPTDPATIQFEVPAVVRRSGQVLRLIDTAGASVSPAPKESLIRLVAQAQSYRDIMLRENITLRQLARRQGVTPSYATRTIRVAFLAPDLVEAIVKGRQPTGLTTLQLLNICEKPDWERQIAAVRQLPYNKRPAE